MGFLWMYTPFTEKEINLMSDNITYTFDMDMRTHSKLKEIAEESHRTLAGQIRLILEDYLEKKR